MVIFYDDAMNYAVHAKDLEWLPEGSQFELESGDPNSNSTSGQKKTYTSFTCSQDSLPEFSNNPIGFKAPLDNIIISKLGPGQVTLPPAPIFFSFSFYFLVLVLAFTDRAWFVLFLSEICISINIYLQLLPNIHWQKLNWKSIKTMCLMV